MGYYISQRDCKFFIAKESFPQVLEAIKALAGCEDRMSGGRYAGGKCEEKWFSWVDMPKMRNATNVFDAIRAWRWEAEEDDEGNIGAILFQGEKFGDDEVLLQQIAPWVKDGSWIEMSGEEGEIWRWAFKDGEMYDQNAKITFE